MQTDIEMMSEGARYVDNVSEELRAELSTLMNSLANLETEWQGRSGGRFDELKVQFDAKLQVLYTKLQELAQMVDTNAQSYGTAEQDQLFQLNEVGSMIEGSPAAGGGQITAVIAGRVG
jgi:WXG100 family type VII secretion target